MTITTGHTITDRIVQLLQHLGVEKAHFASRSLGDLAGLAEQHPEMFASLTMVCPAPPSVNIIRPFGSRLLVFRGDRTDYDSLGQVIETLPGATLAVLHNDIAWSDLVAHHANEILSALLPFLAKQTTAELSNLSVRDGQKGVVAGISYHIQGSGPPIVLMPLGLVPSQWEPIVPILAENYCTITLGGTELGMVSLLEKRARTAGYLDMVHALVQEAQLQPGESVLEVGCGTGALNRWLARNTDRKNPITSVDINRYFLREATDMARNDGLEDIVQFMEGDATALPFDDNQFDMTMSVTVLEEVNADAALAEMIRVTRPGGTVGVIVRAKDIPYFVNLTLDDALKAKIQHPSAQGGDAAEDGCADASLYRRFQTSALTDVKMFPYLAAFNEEFMIEIFQDRVGHILVQAEKEKLQQACAQARANGSFVFSYPHHCAVGKKPA
jgi:SAM-dependent methyltransferase